MSTFLTLNCNFGKLEGTQLLTHFGLVLPVVATRFFNSIAEEYTFPILGIPNPPLPPSQIHYPAVV